MNRTEVKRGHQILGLIRCIPIGVVIDKSDCFGITANAAHSDPLVYLDSLYVLEDNSSIPQPASISCSWKDRVILKTYHETTCNCGIARSGF